MSAPAGYGSPSARKRLERAVNFDAALQQQLLELFRRGRIVLLGGKMNANGPPCLPASTARAPMS